MSKFKNKQKVNMGFTLIELLLVIFIIALLASIVLVSIYKSKQKARDLSTFSSLRSSAGPAYACLNSNLTGVALLQFDPLRSMCIYNSDGTDTAVEGYPSWPDISKNGWSNQLWTDISNSNGFFWCPVGYLGNLHPTSVGNYGGTLGGSSNGSFCYMLRNDDRYMWCTEHGCRKEGF